MSDCRLKSSMTPIKSVEIIRVVRTVTTIGDGTKENPFREVTEFWSMDGRLIGTGKPHIDDKEFP